MKREGKIRNGISCQVKSCTFVSVGDFAHFGGYSLYRVSQLSPQVDGGQVDGEHGKFYRFT